MTMRYSIILEWVWKSGLGTFLKFGCTGLTGSGLEKAAVFSGRKENKQMWFAVFLQFLF